MKTLTDSINEALLNEAADKAMKEIFGKDITLGSKVQKLISDLRMDFRHKDDKFKLFEDGRLMYTNPYLFTGSIIAKVTARKLNMILSPSDKVSFPTHASSASSFDMCDEPVWYMKAVYNALTHKSYHVSPYDVTIEDLDYTAGDYKQDKVSK